MVCSTTPRTTKRYLEELQGTIQRAERNDVLYSEAKNCIQSGDFDSAATLLHLLPYNYRNANGYLEQCTTYDTLCRNGILHRDGCVVTRTILSSILSEDKDAHDIVRYTDALHRNGFNEESIRSITILSAEDALDATEMSDGHRQLFLAYAESNTPFAIRTWNTFIGALQRCTPIVSCIQQTAQKRKVDRGKTKTKEEHDIDEPRQHQENPEAMLVRWKTTEALFNAATGKNDDDDDDDETAGDES